MAQLSFTHLLAGGFSPSCDEDWEMLDGAAQQLFRPRTPIDDSKLFAGRLKQIRDLVEVIYDPGGHAIIYGERGVGKTSLANIIDKKVATVLPSVRAIKVSCGPGDTFFDIWANALHDFKYDDKYISDLLRAGIAPFQVYKMLETLANGSNYIFILDEFDRVRSADAKLYMSDLIKHFSNNPSNITIIIVGVADTVTQLFEDHQSISRCCTQIRMPRMSPDELENIVSERIPRLGMTIDESTKDRMIRYSQGLPGYMHLLGQLSSRAALDEHTLQIMGTHLSDAVDNALEKAEHSTREDYYKAVDSSHPDNTYKEVLLACALAKTNELGRFFAKNLREPYSKIRGKPMGIPNFAPQLGALCEPERGPALIRTGKPKRYQYQFANPLLQPLVIMMGVRDGLISEH